MTPNSDSIGMPLCKRDLSCPVAKGLQRYIVFGSIVLATQVMGTNELTRRIVFA